MSRLLLQAPSVIQAEDIPHREAAAEVRVESSLIAQYVRILLCVQAAFCGGIRLMVIGSQPSVFVGIVASAWLCWRVVYAVRRRWFFPLVTVACTLLIGGAFMSRGTSRAVIAHGPFSETVLLTMLGLLLCRDLADFVIGLRRKLQVPHTRARMFALMMRHGLRILLWGTLGAVMVWSLAVPLIQEAIYQQSLDATDPQRALDRMALPQNILFNFSEAVTGLWFLVVGSCVGSFLNVVIYRVPAGISVVANASHCPVCRTEIAWRDNLPLIGWLKLQGRCRSCQTPISSRYPSVELTVGLLFLLLYFVELISGGTNLPGRSPNHYAGVLWILFYTKWDLLGLYLFHCFVLCAVFAWTMMRRDGHVVPVKAAVITIGLAVTATLIWPHLLPWANGETNLWSPGNNSLHLFVDVAGRLLSGMIVGGLTGCLVSRLCGLPFQLATWLLIGIAFGWQAAVGIGVLCTAASVLWTLADMLPTGTRTIASTGADREPTAAVAQGTSVHSTANGLLATATAIAPRHWLLPVIVLIHHCLWRQLTVTVGGAM